MLRDASLIPLSRQHQHALALCVQIKRALERGGIDLKAWQIEADQNYEQEIKGHFSAEEEVLFPQARRFPELHSLVDELVSEHQRLREYFALAKAQTMDGNALGAFANFLSEHIRKEERQLFEALQKLMPAQQLTTLGEMLERTGQTGPACRIRGR